MSTSSTRALEEEIAVQRLRDAAPDLLRTLKAVRAFVPQHNWAAHLLIESAIEKATKP